MLVAQNIHKQYAEGKKDLHILAGINLEIPPQKKIGIIGASGAGKSTLLHILGGLDRPTEGSVLVEKSNLYSLKERASAALRNRYFGFVFQFYHLLAELTALENVALPVWIAGLSREEGLKKGMDALKRVALDHRATHFPSQMSGGEQQRVALARACVMAPKIILADEPTGNLDEATGKEVLQFLFEVVEKSSGSLVLVTHNAELMKNMDEVWELKDARLQKV